MAHTALDARDLWRWGRYAASLALVVAGSVACVGPPDAASDDEALIDGQADFARIGSDYAPESPDNWSRNATVVVIPWTASGPNFHFACTGVLVSPRIVLTAAHCVRSAGVLFYSVRFGPRRLTAS